MDDRETRLTVGLSAAEVADSPAAKSVFAIAAALNTRGIAAAIEVLDRAVAYHGRTLRSVEPPREMVESVANALATEFEAMYRVFDEGQAEDLARVAIAIVRSQTLDEAARVARGWKSSLRPGTEARRLGHEEAAREIAAAIRALMVTK